MFEIYNGSQWAHDISLVNKAGAMEYIMVYQNKLTTNKKPTIGYSIPDEIPTTCFQLCELV